MATPASDPTRLVRSRSLTIALYFVIAIISLTAMIRTAHASGTVSGGTFGTVGNCVKIRVANVNFDALVACVKDDVGASVAWINLRGECGACDVYVTFPVDSQGNCPVNGCFASYHVNYTTGCPLHASGLYTCTCDDPYVPDSTATSCVAENSCPANMSGTPCACNAGYEPDPSGTGCALAQYTLSLRTDPLDKVAPSGTATVIATVEKSVGGQMSPKSDVLMNIKVDVEAGSGGHDHDDGRHVPPYTGTLDRATGTTLSDGKVGFTFKAPEISGTHTITVACVNLACSNNPQTIRIDVKVDGLLPIPGSPYYALQDSAGNVIGAIKNKHTANHYLTGASIAKLEEFAKGYQKTVNPGARLYLNDASLAWGGLFDVGGNPWKTPHIGHNKGVSIDIRAENSGPNNEGTVPTILFDEVIKQAKKKNIKAALHCKDSSNTTYCLGVPDNRHFHVDF